MNRSNTFGSQVFNPVSYSYFSYSCSFCNIFLSCILIIYNAGVIKYDVASPIGLFPVDISLSTRSTIVCIAIRLVFSSIFILFAIFAMHFTRSTGGTFMSSSFMSIRGSGNDFSLYVHGRSYVGKCS